VEKCRPDHTCGPPLSLAPDGQHCGDADKCKAGQCVPADADCGDELVVLPEECDDGNDVSGDGCESDCRWSCVQDNPLRDCNSDDTCPGKATCSLTHACIPGTRLANLTSCDLGKVCMDGVCTAEYCSNGKKDAGEECDDGNSANGDGCDNSCRFSCVPGEAMRDCHSETECVNDGMCNVQTHQCSPPSVKASGTACGPNGKNNCVHGNCIKPLCGDGVVANGNESCDDGDAVNGDGCDADCTVSCVTAATDCPAAPACRALGCAAGVCTSVADSSKNGQACTLNEETSTCNAGACTSGTCGNGTLEAPEQCDDGNTVGKDGCEANCTPSCSVNADCNDGDSCNGTETCAAVAQGKRCTAGTPLSQGTVCAAGKICAGGSCRPSFCGDSVISGSEECDPPNTVSCDEKCEIRATCNLSGTWALKLTVPVNWGEDAVLARKSGVIHQWGLLSLTQAASATTLTGNVRACGLTIPDFLTAQALGSEWYGIVFPDAGFDAEASDPINLTASVSSLLLGATVSFPSHTILLGLRIGPPANPVGAWPDYDGFTPANGYVVLDADANGRPGFSAGVKTGAVPGVAGANFRNPICDLTGGIENPLRANVLDIAIREIASLTGSVDACTTLRGTTTAAIENHIVGCRRETGETCTVDQAKLADAARPKYAVSNATFLATKLPSGSKCAAVRDAIR
jgi:cysteine-rich repeat protein